jgi:hypothetical protein
VSRVITLIAEVDQRRGTGGLKSDAIASSPCPLLPPPPLLLLLLPQPPPLLRQFIICGGHRVTIRVSIRPNSYKF